MHFIFWIIIGIVSGFIASQIVDKSGKSLVLNLVIGIVGAFLGGWMFGVLGLAFGGWVGSLVTATLGAIVFLLIARAIRSTSSGRTSLSRN